MANQGISRGENRELNASFLRTKLPSAFQKHAGDVNELAKKSKSMAEFISTAKVRFEAAMSNSRFKSAIRTPFEEVKGY